MVLKQLLAIICIHIVYIMCIYIYTQYIHISFRASFSTLELQFGLPNLHESVYQADPIQYITKSLVLYSNNKTSFLDIYKYIYIHMYMYMYVCVYICIHIIGI